MNISRMTRLSLTALALAALAGSTACERSRLAREAHYRCERAAALDQFCGPEIVAAAGKEPGQEPDR